MIDRLDAIKAALVHEHGPNVWHPTAEDDLRWLVAEVARLRIENAHLREAFVVMERGANIAESYLAALRQRHAAAVEIPAAGWHPVRCECEGCGGPKGSKA